jgi:hypothetical protein
MTFEDGSGVCIGARAENANCGDTSFEFDSYCADGLLCVGSSCSTGGCQCLVECTSNVSLCSAGQSCELLSDNESKICVSASAEGQACGTTTGCGSGLICIRDTTSGSHCYMDCNDNQACATGKFCNVYNQGTVDQFAICEVDANATSSSSSSSGSSSGLSSSGGGSSGGASSGGGSSSGGASSSGGNPNGAEYGQSCATNLDCQSGICISGTISGVVELYCSSSCDPRLGHYDCNHGGEREGCMPLDPDDASSDEGQCTVGGQKGTGDLGTTCTSRDDCKYGLCDKGKCTVWCKEDGTCGTTLEQDGYTCDPSEAKPGVCRANSGNSFADCSCAGSSLPQPRAVALTLALLGLLAARRRKRTD